MLASEMERILPERWTAGPEVRLRAARCVSCGATSHPPRPRCRECWAPTETVELGRSGSLYAFTTVHVSTAQVPAPYTLGLVDFEPGVRVVGLLVGAKFEIGAPVETVETSIERATGRVRVFAFRAAPAHA